MSELPPGPIDVAIEQLDSLRGSHLLDPRMTWDRYHTAEGTFGVAAESLLARISSDQPAAAPQLEIGNLYTIAAEDSILHHRCNN